MQCIQTDSEKLVTSAESGLFQYIVDSQSLGTHEQQAQQNCACSQDEQVTWAQHGHTQCVHNTHLLGDLGHAPAMKHFTLRSLLRPFSTQIPFFSLTCMLVFMST